MRGRILCCAALVALGGLAGCSGEPAPAGQGQQSGQAGNAAGGAGGSGSAAGSGSGGSDQGAPPARTDKLADALLPDGDFPKGSRVSRSTKLPPKPDFGKTKSKPAECAEKNAATQIGEGDGEIALANAVTAGGSSVIAALVRPQLDVVSTYRDFVSSCRNFTLRAGSQSLRSSNDELDVGSLGEPKAIGFTQHTTGPGQAVDSVGIAVNTHGVTLNVVVVNQAGGKADKQVAFELAKKSIARLKQVLRG